MKSFRRFYFLFDFLSIDEQGFTPLSRLRKKGMNGYKEHSPGIFLFLGTSPFEGFFAKTGFIATL